MGSSTEGSTNQAEAFTADMAGQTFEINGDDASQTSGLILVSNNGTKYKLSVSDIGALTAEAV